MIRVFPRRTSMTPTDDLAFVGDPPMLRPAEDLPVRVSVTFTWDRREGERLAGAWAQHYSDVELGGPAFDDAGGEFLPGRFVREGVVFTSRGCPHRCGFCVVPRREGRIRELPIRAGWNVQDSNLLGCSDGHVAAVFAMLARQRRAAKFAGGLDARFLEPWHVDALDQLRVDELWFACDAPAALAPLRHAADLLGDRFREDQRRCYVLIGYNGETLPEAEERLDAVFAEGFLPFAQLYRDEDGRIPAAPPGTGRGVGGQWLALQRKWSRPAAYRGTRKRPESACRDLGSTETPSRPHGGPPWQRVAASGRFPDPGDGGGPAR